MCLPHTLGDTIPVHHSKLIVDMHFLKKFFGCRGVEPDTPGHAEKFISAAGGFIGILLAMWISLHYLGAQGAAMLVASMGAPR